MKEIKITVAAMTASDKNQKGKFFKKVNDFATRTGNEFTSLRGGKCELVYKDNVKFIFYDVPSDDQGVSAYKSIFKMGKDGCIFVRKSSNMMRENRYENHLISNQKLLYMAPKDFDIDFEIFLDYVLKSMGIVVNN